MQDQNSQGFSFDMPKGNSSIIKVIGVGGGGNNALKHMYERGIHGVDFIICNTDAQTLGNNPVANKVQLGATITEGLGAGADPEVGEKAAIESIDDIKAALGQHTKMVFITAGMGGGTGTGAAPVVAKIAKEMGILTVGIVTVPFGFEGRRRLEQAEAGLEKLRNNVDSLIVINNDKLRQQFGNLGFKQGFSKADEVLTNAAKGMAEVITAPFQINIDFRDAKSVLENSGTALMSTGIASGEKRAEEAVRKALDSPLLNDNKITGAKDVLLLILSGSDEAHEATMDEIGLINDYVQAEAGGNNSANIIFGVGTDEELGEAIKALVIATGFAKEHHKLSGPAEKIKLSLDDDPAAARRAAFEQSQPASQEEKSFFRVDEPAPEEDLTVRFNVSSTNRPAYEEEIRPAAPQTAPGSTEQKFSLDMEDEDPAEGFSFRVENAAGKPLGDFPTPNEEKPVEFNFFVQEPIRPQTAETSRPAAADHTKVQQPLDDAGQISKPVSLGGSAPAESSFPAAAPKEFYPGQPKAAQEAPIVEQPKAPVADDLAGYTFIDKTSHDQKVTERRNKLKEFNSRYNSVDHVAEFESIPAFRRKNINIQPESGHPSGISTFLSSKKDGSVEIRENRFLNRDVD